MLWFGGVVTRAQVWVNGREVGMSDGKGFAPFEFDATEAAIPGQENLVAARLWRESISALGAGGIMAPVMFWSPKSD